MREREKEKRRGESTREGEEGGWREREGGGWREREEGGKGMIR